MDQEREKYRSMYIYSILAGLALLTLQVYITSHPFYAAIGWTHPIVINSLKGLARSRLFSSPYIAKLIVYAITVMTHIIRMGKGKETSWTLVATGLVAGTALFFWHPRQLPTANVLYTLTSYSGLAITGWAYAAIARNMTGFKRPDNDMDETFPQCDELIETPDSVNIPFRYQYQKKIHKGYINCIAGNRGCMVLGVPGSGKSYAIYNQFIEQMIHKGFVMFTYDYKFPDLTEIVYNEMLRTYPPIKNPLYGKEPDQPKTIKDPKAPGFYIINFNDPRYTNRANPIHSRYIDDPADSAEIADVVMKNISPGTVEKEDFFAMSAKVYLDSIIYFLAIYKDGKYCTFPHVIEMMGVNYKKVFAILSSFDELETKIKPFADALEAGAQDQLQGQIASATIPLNKMASPLLYWVLSGDDFSLDINNPEEPKILCVGNDPNRQAIYGTVLALYTMRLFKLVNQKHKRKCGVLLDELPTIFIKGLDNLIATARSNKVYIIAGAQDKSQLIRDYTEKEANVIFNTVGNIFAGQVNGKTAEDLSKSFGRQFREQHSQTLNLDSESLQVSFHEQDIMPVSKIETLTQGYFFGKVADTHDHPIKHKFFCGEVLIDNERWSRKMKTNRKIPIMTSFNDEEIRRDVHSPVMMKSILERRCRVEAQQKALEAGAIDTDYIEESTKALLNTLTQREREQILDEEAERLILENRDMMVEENYLNIRQDVLDIVEDLLPGTGYKEKPKKEKDPLQALMDKVNEKD